MNACNSIKPKIMPLCVSAAEAGQKLLQYLSRRLALPGPELHRWIRTGQVRINGKRCKPFDRLEQGDSVRVPPFAGHVVLPAEESLLLKALPSAVSAPPLPPLVSESSELLVFCKPSGLATHPGTGHPDSLSTRLAAWCKNADFMPTPAHRLDKDTSGLLLVARTYTALRRLHKALADRHGVHKEYLAWVVGNWPWVEARVLRDTMVKGQTPQGEKTLTGVAQGKDAALTARCVVQTQGCSLLHIRLHTGRTHQIRAQLAARGFPVLGDGKYGGSKALGFAKTLLLHACRIILPDQIFEALPPWQGRFAVHVLPEALEHFKCKML